MLLDRKNKWKPLTLGLDSNIGAILDAQVKIHIATLDVVLAGYQSLRPTAHLCEHLVNKIRPGISFRYLAVQGTEVLKVRFRLFQDFQGFIRLHRRHLSCRMIPSTTTDSRGVDLRFIAAWAQDCCRTSTRDKTRVQVHRTPWV